MNILLVSFGSSGDINPYIAVGVALKKRNHRVTFITNEYYKTQIESYGLNFFPVGTTAEILQLSHNPALFNPKHAFKFITEQIIIRYMRPYYKAIQLLADKNTIVVSQSVAPAPRIAHEKLGIPLVTLNLQPFTFWSIEKPPVYSGLAIPENLPYKIKSFILNNANKYYIDKQFAPGINRFLTELQLPPQKNIFSEWMYSPQLIIGAFPRWFGDPASDWPPRTKLTGFVALENNSEISSEMEQFLLNGDPPLVFTAGSAMQHAHQFFKTAIVVIKSLNKRAIFITSFPDQVPNIDDRFFICSFAPYPKLFPRVEAIIHHGGIGTIAHAIAAGKPQLIVPFAHDQPDNAHRIQKLGLGLKISPRKFTKTNASASLKKLLESKTIINNCSFYAIKVDFSDSLEQICQHIDLFSKMI